MADKENPLETEVYSSEAYLTGLFWSQPERYAFHTDDKIKMGTFGNSVWKFYFRLGREMANRKILIFDDISVDKVLKELGDQYEKAYNNFNGYDTIQQIMLEVENKQDNFDSYFEEVGKYGLMRNLVGLFGDVVIKKEGKYDYHNMNAEQLHKFWMDKVNKLAFANNKIDEDFLLEGLEEAIERWDSTPNVGLEFYHSPLMTKICTGWDHGQVYIHGGFGGKGKTSITMNKVFLSCIAQNERVLVIANEQSKDEFQKLLLVTAMGVGTKDVMKRQRLNEGSFREDEKEKLRKAVQWVRDISSGDTRIVTFVYIEDYNIENIKNIIRHYAMRGVRRVLIDTAKPSEGSPEMQRWQRFVEDFEQIYKLARPNGGGMNLAIWCNVQLNDASLNRRFLNEHTLGDGKKIKNVASVVFLSRPVWDDEYEGEKNELDCWYFVKDEFHEDKSWVKKHFKLQKPTADSNRTETGYYLWFTSKNRRGQDNTTGLDVLILKPDWNSNTWKEIGWCKVYDDRNY